MSPRRWLAAPVLAAALLGVGAAPSSAAVSCTFFANGNLEIAATQTSDQPIVVRSADAILVSNGASAVTCVGSGTVITVDKVIFNATNPDFSEFVVDLAGGPFAPGETPEPDTTDEIEFELNAGPQLGDHFEVRGTAVQDVWRAGRSAAGDGMNLNAGAEGAAADVDVDLNGVDDLDLFPAAGDDRVLLDGGPAFTGPPLDLTETRTAGDVGDDIGAGSGAEDFFAGGPGTDRATGGAGDDTFGEGTASADDEYDGGPGTDLLFYEALQPVRLDLSLLDRQDTGVGANDIVRGVENAFSGEANDVLIGAAGPNAFMSFGGDDIIRIRDGATDTATCGDGVDTVIADIAGVDTIAADCETRTFDVRPDTSITSGPRALTRDSTPTFGFSSTKPGSTFECSIDSGAFAACGTPRTLARLSNGAHGLRVRARDIFGALDLTPVARAFTVDAKRPAISRATIAKRFRLGRKRTAVTAAAGSSFRYRLSEAATVRIKLQRCVRRRGKRCRRYRTVKTLTRTGRRGANRNAFSGRVRGLKARTGLFRATLTATDKAGNRSKAKRLGFRISR